MYKCTVKKKNDYYVFGAKIQTDGGSFWGYGFSHAEMPLSHEGPSLNVIFKYIPVFSPFYLVRLQNFPVPTSMI